MLRLHIYNIIYIYIYIYIFIAYLTINSNKIASNRRVYGSDRDNNSEVTCKLSGPISAS